MVISIERRAALKVKCFYSIVAEIIYLQITTEKRTHLYCVRVFYFLNLQNRVAHDSLTD